MSYEITIKRTETTIKPLQRAWVTLETKEVPREEQFYRDSTGPKTRIEEVRGYAPQIDGPVTETVEVLKQTVDDLDLAAVIKAINKL